MTTPHIPTWTIGERLAKARHDAGLKQVELADAIGIARSSVANYEGGTTKPRRIVINAWSDVTHVPVEWLLEGVEPSGSPEHVTAEYQRAA